MGLGGGGSDRGSYFMLRKITTSEFVYPKKSLFILAYPKKSLSPFSHPPPKSLCFFLATHKGPGIFHRPQNITLGQNFRPKKITRTPPSLKYVSGAPELLSSAFKDVSKFLQIFEYIINRPNIVSKLNAY